MSFFDDFDFLRFFIDILDIFVVALLIYWLLRLIRGTKAVYMLLGLAVAIFAYWVSSFVGLHTLSWLLSHLFGSLLLIVVVVFQSDIRRVLTRMGSTPMLSMISSPQDQKVIDEIVKASVTMANKKIGALIVLEREAHILDYLEMGIRLESLVYKEMLLSIFHPSSPIHDGAVVIQKNRILAAGCFLPMTISTRLGVEVGTRHRAAVSITEETDAVVVVVSEEKGWISVASEGHLTYGLDGTALRRILIDQMQPQRFSIQRAWRDVKKFKPFSSL
ncbi:MAG: diadenylate cyclase CdaA [Bdellovibrionales bacterium]|nr:diadenylate cyclase CdaA [Bdellovibrionales bacterium]